MHLTTEARRPRSHAHPRASARGLPRVLRAGVLALVAAAVALPASAQVLVSQVYGGGGNSGATLRSDFVELHNAGSTTVDLAGWSVQYASAAGTSWAVTPLAGSIGPGQYYLVKEGDGAGGTVALPTPDATGTLALSGTAGKIALVNAPTALSGACPSGGTLQDLVGFGATASCFRGTAPTPAPSNTLAVLRGDGGCTNANDNAADFATGTPTPRNTASTAKLCSGGGQPVLSVADASVTEGNSGQRALTFVLQLNQPAGAGGVSARASTVDGTASAGSDYVALSSVDVTVPAGATTALVEVVVLGDTLNEANETFSLEVSAVTGALPASVRATGTILNDDFSLVPVHAIQGAGGTSPLVGQVVATSGIVTGRKSNGFFLQAPDAEADADPLTSEGILVFTGAAPAAEVVAGARVTVQGTVLEYVPTADPAQPPVTEIGNGPSVVFVSSGHALPNAVALTPTFPDPDGAYDQLERVEGMRVTAAGLTVNAPTGGNLAEATAISTSNGVFHAVVAGVPRAFRTPGVQLPDPLPAGSPANVPRWNTNPEVIAVDSDALGAPKAELAGGCLVTAGATGPLDYTFRRYTLYPETALTTDCSAAAPRPAPLPAADDVSIASYNMQRFFDDVNDPAVGETVLTPAAYQNRLNKASLAIRDFLHAPDILGVVEMENLAVLTTLAQKIDADALAAGQPAPAYAPYLVEGNDVGGIDVGFLVKTAAIAAGQPRVQVVSVEQEGKDTTWTEPAGGSSLLNDRPPLVLRAIVHFADQRSFAITAIVAHQRSLNGADADDASGVRIRAKRQAQAEFLANLVQARQAADPTERVLLMGDFNAFEFNDGYGDPMGVLTGLPSPDDQTVVPGDGADLVTPDLYNLTLLNTPDQSYSYTFDGQLQSLDHVVANSALMLSPELTTVSAAHARLNADFPETARNDPNTPTRLSDHDPTLVLLKLGQPKAADLGVSAAVATAGVRPGEPVTFTVVASNRGPDAAVAAAVGLAFNAVVQPVVSAPAGWTCDAPQVADGRTSVACSTPSQAAGNAAQFSATANAPATVGSRFEVAASVTSQTADPVPGNDTATAGVDIVAPIGADLDAGIAGPRTLPAFIGRALYVVTVRNEGTVAAKSPVLELAASVPARSVHLVPLTGWRCSVVAGPAYRARCTSSTALRPRSGGAFLLDVATRPRPDGDVLRVGASASSATYDTDPGNDSAVFETRLR